jgi:glycosyltransferase involved in cell wall biosynthesis
MCQISIKKYSKFFLMKILVVENEPSSRRGGQEWCLLEICRGLAARGHQIYLIYIKAGDLLEQYQEFCQQIQQVQRFRIDRDRPFSSPLRFCQSLLQSLRLNPNLIYTNHYNDIFFTSLIARLKHLPLVCHLHVFPPRQFGIQCELSLHAATRFITVSHATRSAYLAAGFDPQTVEVVYNGINLDRFTLQPDRSQTRQTLGIADSAFVVLYAGRLDPPKNIEMLLAAFARLDLPQAQLLIAGSPVNHANTTDAQAYVQSLKAQCDRLQISARVQWLGSRSDLPQVYRAADVTVLPSLLPDTFGLVLAESMACGTPALGLRYGGIPEVLSDEFETFQFAVGDEAGLTEQLRSLQNWRSQDPDLSQRCRTYVQQRFSIERSVATIEQVFEQTYADGPKRLGPSRSIVQAWKGGSLEMCEKA